MHSIYSNCYLESPVDINISIAQTPFSPVVLVKYISLSHHKQGGTLLFMKNKWNIHAMGDFVWYSVCVCIKLIQLFQKIIWWLLLFVCFSSLCIVSQLLFTMFIAFSNFLRQDSRSILLTLLKCLIFNHARERSSSSSLSLPSSFSSSTSWEHSLCLYMHTSLSDYFPNLKSTEYSCCSYWLGLAGAGWHNPGGINILKSTAKVSAKVIFYAKPISNCPVFPVSRDMLPNVSLGSIWIKVTSYS